MRGKYKKKKLRKKYLLTIQKYRQHPEQFMEDMYGIKLYWYQKLFIRQFCKNKGDGIY